MPFSRKFTAIMLYLMQLWWGIHQVFTDGEEVKQFSVTKLLTIIQEEDDRSKTIGGMICEIMFLTDFLLKVKNAYPWYYRGQRLKCSNILDVDLRDVV